MKIEQKKNIGTFDKINNLSSKIYSYELALNEIDFRAKGFPDELVDNEPEEKGYEI